MIRVRFSLRFMFVVVTLLCGLFAWLAGEFSQFPQGRREATALRRLQQIRGGEIGFSHNSRIPKWCIWLLDEDSSIKVNRATLVGIKLTDSNLADLQSFQSLDYLRLDKSLVGNKGMHYLARMPSLRFLSLADTNIDNQAAQYLAGLTALYSLDLSGNDINDDALEHLAALEEMIDLDLRSTKIKGHGLIHLRKMQKLEHLQLIDTPFDAGSLKHIADLPRLTALRFPNVTDAEMLHLSNLATLRNLHLSNATITGRGLAHLAPLKNLRSLTLNNANNHYRVTSTFSAFTAPPSFTARQHRFDR